MGLTWNPAALPGLLVLATTLPLALLILWVRPDRAQNRRLSLLLLVEASIFGVAMGGAFLTTDVASFAGFTSMMWVASLLVPWAYLAFLATLKTPLVRWLRGPGGNVFLAAGALGSFALGILRPRWFYRIRHGTGGYVFEWGPGNPYLMAAILLTSLFGLVVAFSLHRRAAPGSPTRASARSYLVAFGVRDVLQFLVVSILLLDLFQTGSLGDLALGIWAPQLAAVLFAILLAYGILRNQLLDIDLKLKWTLERSTVAAVFVAVFFAASEGAQALFADFAGNEFLGIAAAALLVFVLAPLQRLAEHVSDRAMPGVEDTAAYREERAREIYRAAVESGIEDGVITDRERSMLARMQDELGVSAREALRIEREASAVAGVVAE